MLVETGEERHGFSILEIYRLGAERAELLAGAAHDTFKHREVETGSIEDKVCRQ